MTALETRADSDTSPPPPPPDDPAEDIRAAIEAFTGAAETRLAAHDTALTELRTRLGAAETVLRRPGAGATEMRTEPAALETKAWNRFIRGGRESMTAEEIRSLRLSDDTAGGFLAVDQFVVELLRLVVQFSPIRAIARVANTSSSAVLLPKRVGGMTASWVGETAARPETTVTFGQSRYPSCELACWVDVSNAMLEDASFDVASELAFEFAEEFGRAESAAFVNGTGPLQPSGLMQSTELAYTPSGAAAGFLAASPADALIDLYHALAPAYRANGTWLMNSATLATLRKFKNTAGDYLVTVGGIAGAPATTILGRPVVEAPDLPNIGAGAFPVAFGDFMQGFRLFDRVALSVLRDPYSQATNGMVRFHGRRRVAAGVAKTDAIRKLKIATS